MRNINIKAFLYIILILSATIWFALGWVAGLGLTDYWAIIKLLPTVITIDVFLLSLFIKWGWRWALFQKWLVPFPNLNGTWQGYMLTVSIAGGSESRVLAIPTILTVRQTFGNISCVMKTSEMTSYSFSEGFMIDREKQVRQLVYSYTSKPRPMVEERSKAHDGTAVFGIIGMPTKKLEGRYWTDRKTTGEIVLEFRGKKLLEDIPSDLPPRSGLGLGR